MTITLISEDQYNRILEIQANHPILTFQNKGFEYINKSKFTEGDQKAFDEMSTLLNAHVRGFERFDNFCHSRSGKLRLRFQYNWTADEPGSMPFTGVGYLLLEELYKGFKND